MAELQKQYPWTQRPLIAGAPMRVIALSSLATEISRAGGLGFIGAGNDASTLEAELESVQKSVASAQSLKEAKDVLPVGIGFLVWAGEKLLQDALPIIEKYRPAAIWLYAANTTDELVRWTQEIRRVTRKKETANDTKVWTQVGTVQEAIDYTIACQPDVLVVQGQDAGGHGLMQCAGLFALFPEVDDTLSDVCAQKRISKPALIATGGILDGRGAAAALSLGASGVCMGTRYLASYEANIAKGYREDVIKASDGGTTTARTKLYDTLRGTTDWPERYGGRGVLNESFYDAEKGMDVDENKRLYQEAMEKGDQGWGKNGRMTAYAGTGVGLVKKVTSAALITKEVREDAKKWLKAGLTKC